MTALADFFDRYDAQKPSADPVRYATGGDDALREAAALVGPMLVRVAERADVDVDDLGSVNWDRVQRLSLMVIERTIATGSLHVEFTRALRDIAVDGFLAGVLWEQERQMPRLEP